MKRLKLRSPVVPEDSLHNTVADLLDGWLAEPAVWTTFPAGGYQLGRAAAGKLKRRGLKPGMPDIMCWFDHRSMGIELKRDGGTRLGSQRAMHPKLERAGVPVYICRSPEAVLDALLRERFPVKPQIIKALLDRPHERAERPVDLRETMHDHPRPEARGTAEPSQGPRP